MKPGEQEQDAAPAQTHRRSVGEGDSGTGSEGVKARFLDSRHVGRRGRVRTTEGRSWGPGRAVCPEDEVGNCSGGGTREKPGQCTPPRAGAQRLREALLDTEIDDAALSAVQDETLQVGIEIQVYDIPGCIRQAEA